MFHFRCKYLIAILVAAAATALCCTVDIVMGDDIQSEVQNERKRGI